MEQLKAYPTIGACGLDCGLCPRHYTVGPSRCPGCGGPRFLEKHPSCSFITCCVKKKGLEVCGQCAECPCPKFESQEKYLQGETSPSYPPYRVLPSNLRFIQQKGLGSFLRQQEKRIRLLETMIEAYDEGRSRSLFCKAAALLEPRALASLLKRAEKALGEGAASADRRPRAALLREMIGDALREVGVEPRAKR